MTQPATKTTTINGFDPTALESAAHSIADSQHAARTVWAVRSKWQGGTRVKTQIDGCEIGGEKIQRRHTIDCDEPHEVFGSNAAANPQELLLAAVGSCMAVVYALNAATMGIEIHQLEIELSGVLDLRGPFGLDPAIPPGFPEVACKVHLRTDASRAELEELHRSVQAQSPNYYHLTSAIPVVAELLVDN